MTAIALQKYIAAKINTIDDDAILVKIKNLIDSKTPKIYSLNEAQVQLLEEAQIQFKNGDFIDDLEMDKRVEQWQKGK
jgi:hypothetical protein